MLGIGTWILTHLGTVAGLFSPMTLLAGGPIGLVVAWVGSKLADKTVRLVLIAAGVFILVAAGFALGIHIASLERDRAELKVAKAAEHSLQVKYGCLTRPAFQQPLGACLEAREAEAAKATAAEIARQRNEAAAEQARFDAENLSLDAARTAEEQAIKGSPHGRALFDAWTRERQERGIK